MENEIRGYHVYGSSWKPKIGDVLLTDREVSNKDDKFAVAVFFELYVALAYGFTNIQIILRALHRAHGGFKLTKWLSN